jgi:hypothetical protein
MDVPKVLRLQGTIRASLEAVPIAQAAHASETMAHTYRRARAEVLSAIPDVDREEFERLFPEQLDQVTDTSGGRIGMQVARYNTARNLLGSMAGWLDGYVRAAQMQVEASAYAQERVKAERGIGFKGSDS